MTELLSLQPDGTTGLDAYIRSSGYANNNYGITTIMVVGDPGTGGDVARGLLAFDISGVPESATVVLALLTLWCPSETNVTDRTIDLHRALTQWYKGEKNGTAPDASQDGSTWNYRNKNGDVAWGAAGGLADTDYASAISASAIITGTGKGFVLNVTDDVQDWHEGTATNYGWFLINAEESTTGSAKNFSSSNNTTASQRPKLEIFYDNYTDPYVSLQPGSEGSDTYIYNGATSYNYGVATQIFWGRLTSIWRGLLKFDISAIPENATIVSAILTMYCDFEVAATDRTAILYRLLAEWYEGAKDGAAPDADQDGSTWALRNKNGDVAWDGGAGIAAGVDRSATATASTSITQIDRLFDFDVTEDVQDWYNGDATNYGWCILGDESTTSTYKRFSSSDHAVATQRPRLVVTYVTDYTTLELQPASGYDTSMSAGSSDGNYGAAAYLIVGTTTSNARSLLKIDISSIPAGVTIDRAILALYCDDKSNPADYAVGVHRCLVDWYEGAGTTGQEPGAGVDASVWDYRNHNGSVAWGAAGGLADTDYTAAATDSVPISWDNNTFYWDVTADVQAWYDSEATNYGWFLINEDESTLYTRKQFVSSDGATASQRPKLTILYSEPTGRVYGPAVQCMG